MVTVLSGIGPERSVCQGWQVDGGIIAQGSDGFQGQITGALDGPLVILLEKNGADEASDGVFVRKDADHIGAAFNLAVQAFEGVDGVDLGPVLLGEGHVGEDVCFGLVHELGEPADRRPQLVGHFASLGSGGIGIILGEGGGDEGRNHAATALAGMGERIAHEMNPGPLSKPGFEASRAACDPALATVLVVKCPPARSSVPEGWSSTAASFSLTARAVHESRRARRFQGRMS